MSQNAGESSKCAENDSKSVSATERINLFYDLMAEDKTTTEHIKGVRGISQMSRGQYINHEVKEHVIEKGVLTRVLNLLQKNIKVIFEYGEDMGSQPEDLKIDFISSCDLCSNACRVVFNFSVDEKTRKVVTQCGFITPLIQVATYVTRRTVNAKTILCKTNAIGAIANLATSPENKFDIVKRDGLTPLIDAILSVDTNVFQELDAQKSLDSMCQHSCRALFALSANDDNKLLIEQAGGLRPLVRCLRARSWHIQWHAAGAVANLAIEKKNKLKIVQHGGLEPLIELAFSDRDRVQRQVARGLFALAAHPDIRPGIVDSNGLQALNHLLSSHHEEVQRNAVGAIGNIAMSDNLKDRVFEEGIVIPILDLANSTNEFVQRQTARTLFTLSAHESVKSVIVREGGLLPLVHLAQSSFSRMADNNSSSRRKSIPSEVFEIQRDVAGAIANIAIGRGNKEKVADSGAIYPLIQLATSPNANVQRQAARALFALAGSEKNQREILKCKGLMPLLNLLSSSKVEVRKHAAGAVANIATNKDIKSEIIQSGALEPLLQATKSSDKHVQKQAVRGLRNLGVKDINVDVMSCEYRRFASEMLEYVDVDVDLDDDSDEQDKSFCDLMIVYEKMPNEESKLNDPIDDFGEPIKAHEILIRTRAPKIFDVLRYTGPIPGEQESRGRFATLSTSMGSRQVWVLLLEFLYCGFIESFDLDIKNISREQLPILDALTELGEVFSIDSLIEYTGYLRKILHDRKRRYRPQPFAISHPCNFLMAFTVGGSSDGFPTSFDNGLLSDITFRTEDNVRFCLHKVIICARCPYFRALFMSGMRESRQGVIDVPWEGQVFQRVVEYMYSGSTDISPDVACDLLMASNEWDMQGLQSMVEDELGQMIDEDSVMMILTATCTVKAPRLKARCIHYLLKNFEVTDITSMIDDPLIDKTLRYDIVDKINSWGFSKRDNDDDCVSRKTTDENGDEISKK